MNDRENFINRWSRRKREAAHEKAQGEQTGVTHEAKPAPCQDTGAKSDQSGLVNPSPVEFDAANLPPIESISADTDITAFMRAGVPSELRHAALRRAWSADASIRDFVGLNENYWNDLTGPLGTAGFGDLDPGLDVKQMVSELFGENASQNAGCESSTTSAAPTAASRPGTEEKVTNAPDLNTSETSHTENTKVAATQNHGPDERTKPGPIRRHGGAMPE